MNCILCNSTNNYIVEKILVKDLNKLYKKNFNLDINYLFDSAIVEFRKCSDCDLRFFSPAIAGDDKFYNILIKNCHQYYMDEKEEFLYTLKYINKSSKILEVGSGKGAFTKKINSDNYVGLDLSTKAKEISQSLGIPIKNQSIQEHSLDNKEQYDIVCGFQILEHVSSIISFLKACVDCLKKDGLLILSVPSNDSYLSNLTNASLNLPPHHISRWSDKALKSISKLFNLELIEIKHETLSDFHKLSFANTLINHSIKNFLKMENKIFDLGLMNQVITKTSSLFGKFLTYGITDNMRPHGHTVIAVFKKV